MASDRALIPLTLCGSGKWLGDGRVIDRLPIGIRVDATGRCDDGHCHFALPPLAQFATGLHEPSCWGRNDHIANFGQ